MHACHGTASLSDSLPAASRAMATPLTWHANRKPHLPWPPHTHPTRFQRCAASCAHHRHRCVEHVIRHAPRAVWYTHTHTAVVAQPGNTTRANCGYLALPTAHALSRAMYMYMYVHTTPNIYAPQPKPNRCTWPVCQLLCPFAHPRRRRFQGGLRGHPKNISPRPSMVLAALAWDMRTQWPGERDS